MERKKVVLHNLIIKEGDLCASICLELDVASQGETAEEAEKNLEQAVELYLEDVYESGDEQEFIPRPAPAELWAKYFSIEADNLKEELKSNIGETLEYKSLAA